MKVYLAGNRETVKDIDDLPLWVKFARRRLFSYYYHELSGNPAVTTMDIQGSHKIGLDTFLDSGAFTAFTKGINIPLERYGKWILEHGQYFNVLSSLDAIGGDGAARSYDNFHALRSMGCDVCPVFHAREDMSWLVKYLDEGHPYIFLGGMVPESTAWLTEWLDRLFLRYLTLPDGTPRVKVHGFGMTSQDLIFRYPWFSVDSASWLMSGVFGSVLFYDDRSKRLVKVSISQDSPEARDVKRPHYSVMNDAEKRRVDDWLKPYGITAEQCATHYSYRDAVNAATYQDLEKHGVDRFSEVQETLF